jgi:hypothetical protein
MRSLCDSSVNWQKGNTNQVLPPVAETGNSIAARNIESSYSSSCIADRNANINAINRLLASLNSVNQTQLLLMTANSRNQQNSRKQRWTAKLWSFDATKPNSTISGFSLKVGCKKVPLPVASTMFRGNKSNEFRFRPFKLEIVSYSYIPICVKIYCSVRKF